jgi:micrococcal nuclease
MGKKLDPWVYNARLIRVVDGDTIDANIDLGFDVSVKKRIRFMGVNAPESRKSSWFKSESIYKRNVRKK